MIIKKVYDENTKTQKVWYDSSMIVYSEMVEDAYENVGELYIVFKNGTRYVYHGVKFEDYVLLLAGGTDASQGKTLNKVIKGKYEYEKLEDANLELINEELNKVDELVTDVQNTYFISGHRDITPEEFEFNYEPMINMALQNPDAKFIVGDYYGADIMAQNYLLDILMVDPDIVTVYHMLEAPRNANPKVTHFKGGFKSDEERDAAMTKDSFQDIAFVRDNTKISGTGQNILRRHLLK